MTPVLLLVVLALAGCGGSNTRLQAPVASVQQLTVQTDGSWIVVLRLQNYSYDTGMHVYKVDVALSVGGQPAGQLTASPGLDIPAMDADTATARLSPGPEARSELAAARPGAIGYTLKGTLLASKKPHSKPQTFKLDGQGFISPVPGVSHIWR